MGWWQGKRGARPDSRGDFRLFEAILMVVNEPISVKKLSAIAGYSDLEGVRGAIATLNQGYDRAGRAYRIEEIAGGVQLLTRKQFATWIRRADQVPPEQLLSAAMLETLAIVAYRQPVVRAEIEAIRGVGCDEVLRQLMQRELIRISGRDEDLGRPFLYETTGNFLRIFGLQSIDSLPRFQRVLEAEAEIGSRMASRSPQAKGE